ncbi:MAG: LytTR family transcriptional regulator [Saprospiraceae bacterium]|nr:LytTR family transcriptional regulator [Saprospiraceae bacterium]
MFSINPVLAGPSSLRNSLPAIFLIFLLIALLGIMQDYISAEVRNSAFYFSESSLYKVHWILFVPVVFALSKSMNTDDNPYRLVLKTLLLTPIASIVHLVSTVWLIHFISWWLMDHTYQIAQIVPYFLSEEIFFLMLVYLVIFVVLQWKPVKSERKNVATADQFIRSLPVHNPTNSASTWLMVDEIFSISTDRPYLSVQTRDRRFLYKASLKELQKKLNPGNFVRIHRSTIVNLKHIRALKSRGNGDYDLHLTNGNSIRLSRSYAYDLKSSLEVFNRLSH